MYVSKEVADFRKDCLTEAAARQKIQRMSVQMGGACIIAGSGVFAPILMCEQGARKRGIDLEVAAGDAKHWWQTGQVPVRATPLATAKRRETTAKSSGQENKWWQFWK